MYSRGATTKCHDALLLSNKLLQVLFESIYVWPQGHDPLRVKGLLNKFHFVAAHVSEAKVNSFHYSNTDYKLIVYSSVYQTY